MFLFNRCAPFPRLGAIWETLKPLCADMQHGHQLFRYMQVQWLAHELWPAIRRQLGDDAAQLHLYGAYPTHAVQRLHDPVWSFGASVCRHAPLHAGVYKPLLCAGCCVAHPANDPTIQPLTLLTCVQANKLFVKGSMGSLDTLRQYRVALAPLRFGAGLKGKVVDSWAHGLPVRALNLDTA